MSNRTIALPDGRAAVIVPADEAGEFLLSAAEGLLAHLAERDMLTRRQLDAAATLARLYGIGGGRQPWRRTGGGERSEEATAAARQEFDELLSYVPHRSRWPVTVLCMGEWPVAPTAMSLIRDGLDAVADRLRLA